MNYKVLNLEEGEDVILEVRKHWIVFAGYGAVLVFIALMPLMALTFFEIFGSTTFQLSLSGQFYTLFSFFYILWVLTLWIFFFLDWTKYYLDVWYVTEKRIIIIDQQALFDRRISNVRFDKVQDISLDVDGVIATFLDFGDIVVQTASEDNTKFTMTTVRHPEEVRRIIFSQHNTSSEKNKTPEVGNTLSQTIDGAV